MSCLNFSCVKDSDYNNSNVNYWSINVIDEIQRKNTFFTQGLFVEDGILYETTGGYSSSYLRMSELPSLKIIDEYKFSNDLFIEGSTTIGEKIYVLTWKSAKGFVFTHKNDKLTLLSKGFSYLHEGWGLSGDKVTKQLILSDGTDVIRFIDNDNFKELRRINVTENGFKINNINELEFINNRIWANIWLQNKIIIINPLTGVVEGVINIDINKLFSGEELAHVQKSGNVLNGIAYDAIKKNIYITGKNWPKIFLINLKKKEK